MKKGKPMDAAQTERPPRSADRHVVPRFSFRPEPALAEAFRRIAATRGMTNEVLFEEMALGLAVKEKKRLPTPLRQEIVKLQQQHRRHG